MKNLINQKSKLEIDPDRDFMGFIDRMYLEPRKERLIKQKEAENEKSDIVGDSVKKQS